MIVTRVKLTKQLRTCNLRLRNDYMKKLGIIVLAITLLTWGSIGQASIVATFNVDGGMVDQQTLWDGSQLTVTGTQQALLANATGAFDTLDDSAIKQLGALKNNPFVMTPSRSSYSTITQVLSPNNNTGLAWNGYQIWVSSTDGTPFQVSNPTVDMYQASTDQTIYDWTISASALSSTSWVLVAYGGTLVQPGDGLDLSFQMTYTASGLNYKESYAAMGVAPVPEPGTLVLALSGLLGLAALRVARRRRA